MSAQPDLQKFMTKVQGGRMYLTVAGRLVWFRAEHPDWGIVTEALEINHEKQFAVFRATIYTPTGQIMATATKKEDAKGFGDFIEKSETGSIGRALNLCGFGTDDLDDQKHEPHSSQQHQQPQRQPSQSPTFAPARPQPAEQAQKPQTAPQPANAAQLAAEYRRKAGNVHGRWEKGIQEEWLAYIKETYGADSIAQVSDECSFAVWEEIVAAQKEAQAVAKPGPPPAEAAPNP